MSENNYEMEIKLLLEEGISHAKYSKAFELLLAGGFSVSECKELLRYEEEGK